MEKIIIAFWAGAGLPAIPYKHLQEFKYTSRRRNNIIDTVLGAGCYVMLKVTDDRNLIVWIDNKRFTQR